jgi:hypothetical protein
MARWAAWVARDARDETSSGTEGGARGRWCTCGAPSRRSRPSRWGVPTADRSRQDPPAAYRDSTGGDFNTRNLQKTTTTVVHDGRGAFDMSHMHDTPTTDRAGPRGAFDTHHMHNTPTTDRSRTAWRGCQPIARRRAEPQRRPPVNGCRRLAMVS